jgi:hypothetical protein
VTTALTIASSYTEIDRLTGDGGRTWITGDAAAGHRHGLFGYHRTQATAAPPAPAKKSRCRILEALAFEPIRLGVKPALLLQYELMADVRCGSKADMEARAVNVCFTPKNGHWNSAM